MDTDNYWSRGFGRLNRRRLLASAGAAGAAAALAACSSRSGGPSGGGGSSAASPSGAAFKPQKGGTLIFASTGTTDMFVTPDPHQALPFSIFQIISRNALRLNGDTKKVEGQAVQSWEQPGDGSQFILHVRPNLKIQNRGNANGRTFTAEDLAFNINRIAGKLDPQHFALYQRASTMYGLDHTEVVDPLTVKVVMERPSATFLNGLAHQLNAMVPKYIVDADPQFQNWDNFAGIGPFQIKSHQSGGTTTLVRNPDYYEDGLPYLDEYDELTLPDTATKLSAFLSGKIDMYEEPSATDIPTIKAGLPNAKLYNSTGMNWYHFRFQTQKPPFTDVRVRKALFLALDYKDIGDGAWGSGWGYTGAMIPAHPEGFSEDKLKTLPGLNPNTKDKDRQTAKQLMTAAGYPDGEISFSILLANPLTTGAYISNATRAQDQWKKLWSKINPTIQPPPDVPTFNKLQATNDFMMIAYTNTAFPDASLEMGAQWHSLSGLLGSRNYGQFKNADADAMIEKALVTIDFDQRKQILQDFEQHWFDDWMPLIPLHTGADRYFVGPHFGNFQNLLGPWWFINYRLLTLAERFSRVQ